MLQTFCKTLLTNDFVPLLYLINQCIYFNCMKVLSAVYYQYVHFYGHKTNQLNFLSSFIKIVVRHMFNIEFFEKWLTCRNIRLKNPKCITRLGTFYESILLWSFVKFCMKSLPHIRWIVIFSSKKMTLAQSKKNSMISQKSNIALYYFTHRINSHIQNKCLPFPTKYDVPIYF